MQDVHVDPAAGRVRVGAGARWELVVPRLSAHGLACLHGSSPDVGIAGYSLAGGIGWLARKHGLQANAVTALELVTAGGALLRTDAEEHAELFWALRGGGGNFGVVTALEFAVHAVDDLYAGALFFPFERSGEVLREWSALLPSLPDELTTWASVIHFPPLPDVPAFARGRSFAVVMGAFLGSEADGRDLRGRCATSGRSATPSRWSRRSSSATSRWTRATRCRSTSPTSAGRAAGGHDRRADGEGRAGLGPRADRDDAAVPSHRRRARACNTWRRGPRDAAGRGVHDGARRRHGRGVPSGRAGRARRIDAAVLPHRAGDYPNFVEVPADASAFFAPDVWARLREVKVEYDPTDVFAGNHHIPPAE